MADATLDDIIKQNKQKRTQGKKKFNVQGGQMRKPQGANIGARPVQKMQSPLLDARNRIIQKKRLRMKDARERLAEIAKGGDARDRINKIRKTMKTGQNLNVRTARNIQVKTAQNVVGVPKRNIPLVKRINNKKKPVGQTRMQGKALVRTVPRSAGNDQTVVVRGTKPVGVATGSAGVTVKKTVALRTKAAQPVKASNSGRSHPLPNNPHVVTIKNDKAEANKFNARPQGGMRGQNVPVRRGTGVRAGPQMRSAPMAFRPPMRSGIMGPAPQMRSGHPMQYGQPMQRSQAWMEPEPEALQPTRLRITTPNNYREPDMYDSPGMYQGRMQGSGYGNRGMSQNRPFFENGDMDMDPYSRKIGGPMSAGLRSRMDEPQERRVVVSNLHPCVTVEDMEELLGTVGPLRSVRMIREGVTEAYFVLDEDAFRAVELFNHRQLDGLPMNVVVVSNKQPLMPTPSLAPRSVLRSARGRTGFYR